MVPGNEKNAGDSKVKTPRAIKVQHESMKLFKDLEKMRRLKQLGSSEDDSPITPPITSKTKLRRGQHQ